MHPLLLSALIQIESNGNDQAKGRHGELGALQIRPILVRDVNRIMGTHYAHAQVTNRAVSTFIAQSYLAHYGKNLSDEDVKTAGYCFGVASTGCPSALGLENNVSVFYGAPRTVSASIEYRFR